MKILELAPYIFIENHKYGSKNKSGLAYMIRAITDMLSKEGNDVYVLTQSILCEEMRVNDWHMLKRNFCIIGKHLRFKYIKVFLKVQSTEISLKSKLKTLLYFLSGGQVEYEIRRLRPDVIHIHSINLYTIPYLIAASQFNIPVLTTLHGLVSFNDITGVNQFAKSLERNFLRVFVENGYSLSFISTGMKMKTERYLGRKADNIRVVPNTFQLSDNNKASREEDRTTKRIICVGSVTDLKNHIQVIRVLPLIQSHFFPINVELSIIGDGPKLQYLKNYASNEQIGNITFCGRLKQKDVYAHLSHSDLLVFPSIEEGFGIPIVEAYSCGVPAVFFSDIDASEDVYSIECSMMPSDRTDSALCECIISSLETKWDKKEILKFSQQFDQSVISTQYAKVVRETTNSLDPKVITDMINLAISTQV